MRSNMASIQFGWPRTVKESRALLSQAHAAITANATANPWVACIMGVTLPTSCTDHASPTAGISKYVTTFCGAPSEPHFQTRREKEPPTWHRFTEAFSPPPGTHLSRFSSSYSSCLAMNRRLRPRPREETKCSNPSSLGYDGNQFAAMRGPVQQSDFLSVFDQRVQRRLAEMTREAHRESQAIIAEMSARGLGISGPRVQKQLDAITAVMHCAIDWALTEADRLPGQKNITRGFVLGQLTTNLNRFAEGICEINTSGLGQGVMNYVAEHRRQLMATLEAELHDFAAGIWNPRNSLRAGGAPEQPRATHNTVNIHGANQGIIQQTGSHSNATATLTTNDPDCLAALERAEIDRATRNEIEAELETVRLQLRREKPNTSVIKAAVSGIHQIAIGVAANALAPYVLALMAAVDLNLPAM